jgi:hypothetical protein
MNLELIEKSPEIGDYVFCARSSDRSPNEGWSVGILATINEYPDNYYKKMYKTSDWAWEFPFCMVITPLQGALILGVYPSLGRIDWRLWNKEINELADESVISFFRLLFDPKEPTEDD